MLFAIASEARFHVDAVPAARSHILLTVRLVLYPRAFVEEGATRGGRIAPRMMEVDVKQLWIVVELDERTRFSINIPKR